MTTSRKARGVLLCLLALSAAIPDAAQAFLLYAPAVLGEGTPVALNEPGQVVGRSHDADGELTVTLWEHGNGAPRYLLPGQPSTAYDINDHGDILAAILGASRARIITPKEEIPLYGLSTRALNNLLQVVCGSGIWEAGEIRSIDGVNGHDINDRGQVAGFRSSVGAVVWDNDVVTPVGPEELTDTSASAINESGQVVGFGTNAQRRDRAFYWDGVSSVVLATLAGEGTRAHALNDLSQIVGRSETEEGERHAVLWEDGEIADLNDLLTEPFPYTLVEAVDINNRGQIACRAEDASGGSWAVLLNPIPEPGALLLAVGGAAALRRRRRGLP